jgi:tungstate transport system substrate-binding protein
VRYAVRLLLVLVVLAAWLGFGVACAPAQPTMPTQAAAARRNASDLILATTTSTQDSGLLDVLVPMFEQQSGYRVKTISVGTGAALALGARGEADVVLVHAPNSETAWMAEGNGTERLLVMHNDFVIVGSEDDPAHVRDMTSALGAFKSIAASGSGFVSRGDHSGTHQLELALWKQASIAPRGHAWYIESGTGMGQTLMIASDKLAYTLSDRATWLAQNRRVQLPMLLAGDPALFNVYHVMPVNPAKFPGVSINAAGGKAFADFLVAPATQEVIGSFGRDQYGQVLFIPDAGKPEPPI